MHLIRDTLIDVCEKELGDRSLEGFDARQRLREIEKDHGERRVEGRDGKGLEAGHVLAPQHEDATASATGGGARHSHMKIAGTDCISLPVDDLIFINRIRRCVNTGKLYVTFR